MRAIIFLTRASFLFLLAVVLPFVAQSQDRCGTVEYMKTLKGESLHPEKLQFEQWLEQRRRTSQQQQRQQTTYQIPVVVHVIHNGEAIGSGRNISDAQVLSQISVLNKDFQRLNTDASQTPAEFQSIAGSLDVEFVLARQDPEGLATTGIVRVQGTKSSWSMNDNYQLKSLSYWPAENYLNIWVCNLSDLLGYAQFPVSDLPGLANSSDNRLTDGVVLAYNAFGSKEDGEEFPLLSSYNRGRTATHEIGHFFGLRHIWGDDDGGCGGTDYVDDTPNQESNSSGCPTHPRTSCGQISMSQNYLDYTNDVCMNLFTVQQVNRMMVVLENSPRRASLLKSPGLSDPLPVANDLGIREINSPLPGACTSELTPVIDVRNYGSNSINATQISMRVDGVLQETKDFALAPSLAPLASALLNFTPLSFASGTHTVTFEITETNSVADGSSINNILSRTVVIPETIELPIIENFTDVPPAWRLENPDGKITWQLVVAPKSEPSNTAMKMDFYNYEDNLGEIDALVTPVFDLSDEPVALLLFDVAYARFDDDNDGLRVVLLSDCNTDITQGTIVYEKTGATLQTRSPTTNEFVPSQEGHWRNEFVDLSAFAGQSNLQLAFVGINDWGNNLYLDNISLVTSALNDVAIRKVISPSPVVCVNEIHPKIEIYNAGTIITSLKVRTTINGQSSDVQTFSGLTILGGSTFQLDLSPVNLRTGTNTLYVELLEPNGVTDINSSNNALTYYSIVNESIDVIPVRQTFEQEEDDAWSVINPLGGMVWEQKRIGSNTSIVFNAYSNPNEGDQSWLVSPVLDFSTATQASLAFDVAYASRSELMDELLVLASTDCGITFSDTLLRPARSLLTDGKTSTGSWQPAQDSDWEKLTIELPNLVGGSEVRLAFVLTNGNGNNMYLDNIEIFTADEPVFSDFEMVVHPNPFYIHKQDDEYKLQLTFNVAEKIAVSIEIIDMLGRVLVYEEADNILNQTYAIDMPDIPSGSYLVRAKTAENVLTQRVIIMK